LLLAESPARQREILELRSMPYEALRPPAAGGRISVKLAAHGSQPIAASVLPDHCLK